MALGHFIMIQIYPDGMYLQGSVGSSLGAQGMVINTARLLHHRGERSRDGWSEGCGEMTEGNWGESESDGTCGSTIAKQK